ncbi:MAG: hypothetical protein LBT00_08680 [Spirochaetaceae bacterium]|nr:hypothetical protein [Spirochaetaceae bacterium]
MPIATKQSSRGMSSPWIASLGNVPLARNDRRLARNDGRIKSVQIRVICG